MTAAEMNGVTTAQECWLKGWHGDDFGLQIGGGVSQSFEIFRVGEDGEICIAAKFGRAV